MSFHLPFFSVMVGFVLCVVVWVATQNEILTLITLVGGGGVFFLHHWWRNQTRSGDVILVTDLTTRAERLLLQAGAKVRSTQANGVALMQVTLPISVVLDDDDVIELPNGRRLVLVRPEGVPSEGPIPAEGLGVLHESGELHQSSSGRTIH